jgi:hypothetical protein
MKLTRLVLLGLVGVATVTITLERIQVLGYTRSEAIDVISTAQDKTILCFGAATEAERFGANISLLLETLTSIGDLLFRAGLALSTNEFNTSVSFAARANEKLEGLITEANDLRDIAQQKRYLESYGTALVSAIGAVIVIFGSFLGWRLLQVRSDRGLGEGLEGNRPFFAGVAGLLLFLAISPILSGFLALPRTEFFTEFWVLGPNQRAQSYPFNITAGRQHRLFLGVGNHLGQASYYKAAVKLSNKSSGQDGYSSSEFPAAFNKTFFVADEDAVEHLIAFSFDYELSQSQSQINIRTFTLNEVVVDMSGLTLVWDSKNSGFMGSLQFELWAYNQTRGVFEYQNQLLRLTLNFTTAGLMSPDS